MRQQRAKLSDELDRGMSNKAKNEEEQLHQASLFFSLANFNILSSGNIVFFFLNMISFVCNATIYKSFFP